MEKLFCSLKICDLRYQWQPLVVLWRFAIHSSNLNIVLPQLQLDSDVIADTTNAVNSGKQVTVSQSNITFNGWVGCGYVVFDPVTGEGAYMISGGLNGAILMFFGALLMVVGLYLPAIALPGGIFLVLGAMTLVLGMWLLIGKQQLVSFSDCLGKLVPGLVIGAGIGQALKLAGAFMFKLAFDIFSNGSTAKNIFDCIHDYIYLPLTGTD